MRAHPYKTRAIEDDDLDRVEGDYLRFYLGTTWIARRADLSLEWEARIVEIS